MQSLLFIGTLIKRCANMTSLTNRLQNFTITVNDIIAIAVLLVNLMSLA